MLKKKRTSLGSCTKRFGKAPKKSAKRRTHKKPTIKADADVVRKSNWTSPDGNTVLNITHITKDNKTFRRVRVDNDSKK